MNRQSMLTTGPKKMKKVAAPGAASSVASPGVRKARTPDFAPQAASTRMYGKPDPAPAAAGAAQGFLPGMGLPNV